MDIFINLNSKKVEFGSIGGLDSGELVKIRQTEDLRLCFHRDGTPELISASDALFVGLKRTKASTDTLASQSTWTHPGAATGFYTGSLNLNTTQITDDLFDVSGAADQYTVLLEITRTPSGGEPRRYDDASLTLVRSTFTGGEGTPTDASTPALYSTTAEADLRYPRWLSGITGLTGGGATNMDGLASVSLPVGQILQFILSGEFQVWEIQAVSTAENAANGIVRFDDFHASANVKTAIRIA